MTFRAAMFRSMQTSSFVLEFLETLSKCFGAISSFSRSATISRQNLKLCALSDDWKTWKYIIYIKKKMFIFICLQSMAPKMPPSRNIIQIIYHALNFFPFPSHATGMHLRLMTRLYARKLAKTLRCGKYYLQS